MAPGGVSVSVLYQWGLTDQPETSTEGLRQGKRHTSDGAPPGGRSASWREAREAGRARHVGLGPPPAGAELPRAAATRPERAGG